MEDKKEKNIGIEILRILSMFAIVILHIQSKTGIIEQYGVGKEGWLSHWGIQSLCYVSVNCYVMISGYFLSNENTKFNFKKIIELWITVEFWSLLLFIATTLFSKEFSIRALVVAVFPVLTREYWFVTVYIALYLIAPYVNKVINNLNKNQYGRLVIIILALFSIWPSVIPISGEDGIVGLNGIGGTNLLWFTTVYIIAGYFRRFIKNENIKPVYYLIGYLGSIGVMLGFQLLMNVLNDNLGIGGSYGTWMMNYASIVNIVASSMIFLFFATIKLKLSDNIKKTILFLSQGTFGVYLIHEHPLMRPLIWNPVRNTNLKKLIGIRYIGQLFLVAAMVFLICCLMENIRRGVFFKIKKYKNKHKVQWEVLK